jgi:hypothetical protein
MRIRSSHYAYPVMRIHQHMPLCSNQYHQSSRDIGFQDIGFIWERHRPRTDWHQLEQPIVWICLSSVFTAMKTSSTEWGRNYLFPVSVAQQQQRSAAGQKNSARHTAMMKPIHFIRILKTVVVVNRSMVLHEARMAPGTTLLCMHGEAAYRW